MLTKAFCATALVLAVLRPIPDPASAQQSNVDCGREDHESGTTPGEIWFNVFDRRSSLALSLQNNGNWDLARRFRECALMALMRAAELGYREAQYQYALRLALRKPQTPETKAETYEWMRKAAQQGHERAKLLLKTMTRP